MTPYPTHAPYETADAYALKAVANGTANEEQQRRAMRWVIEAAAGTYELSYRPGDSSRDTDFAEGRRFVGLQIVKLINMPGDVLNPRRTSENG